MSLSMIEVRCSSGQSLRLGSLSFSDMRVNFLLTHSPLDFVAWFNIYVQGDKKFPDT